MKPDWSHVKSEGVVKTEVQQHVQQLISGGWVKKQQQGIEWMLEGSTRSQPAVLFID